MLKTRFLPVLLNLVLIVIKPKKIPEKSPKDPTKKIAGAPARGYFPKKFS